MTLSVGTYHFGRRYSNWGIYKVQSISNGVTMSSFVKVAFSYEEAVRETYRLNGWGTPKKIYRRY